MTGPRHRGTVLVMVLVIIALLSVAAAGQMLLIRSETGAASASQQGYQARATAMSGIHRAMAMLAAKPNDYHARTDNPELFQAQVVTGDAETGWCFTVFTGDISDPSAAGVRYGLEDEAGKININTASTETLAALPGMTAELADCLTEYRKNRLATLEELLLADGFTGSVVFGEDANLNSLLEPNEDDADESFPPDDGDGQLNRGLMPFATVVSYEPNTDNDGNDRININREDADGLKEKLKDAGFKDETADFLQAAREAGVEFTDPSQLLGMKLEVGGSGDSSSRGGRSRRGGNNNNNNNKTTIESGVDANNLSLVMDKLTTGGVKRKGREILEGRVNVNSAPKEVLSALPGIGEDAARQIVDARGGLDEQVASTTAWIYTQNIVSADVFKKVSPLLTARSRQFRVRSFGYPGAPGSGGQFCVLEAIIDTASGTPRIVYLRNLTHMGVPMTPKGVER